MNPMMQTAIDAALKSGALIRRSVGKVGSISYKGRDNIVTDVDKRSEELIIGIVSKKFPAHSIISEERPPERRASPYAWIIDPIDGTTNFAHAFPFFSVSIGIMRDDEIVAGVIYDPMRDELFRAEKGKGAYLNKTRIHVSGVKMLSKSFLATGFSYGITRKDRNIGHFRNLLVKTMAIRRAGSAALDMSYVACGRFDGYWELDLKAWDCAAGMAIVKEAGGRVTKLDGTLCTPFDKSILTSNNYLHSQLVRALSKA